jgi:hypothetical protein
MRNPILYFFILFCTGIQAQSWTYVGSSCPNAEGSAKIKIKSNGNIVSAAQALNSIVVKEWNGSAWTALPSPATNGIIGMFHLEMHQDTAYLGISNSGFKVFKWSGTSWVQLGSTLAGTFSEGNHDFLLDNNGVPYIGLLMQRQIQRLSGNTWQEVITLPTGTFPNTYAQMFGSDNTLFFNNQNELVYAVAYKNREMVRKINPVTAQDEMVGDTAIFLKPFSQYAMYSRTNAQGELFAFFSGFGLKPFVKKLVGNTWQLYGDSATFGIAPGNMLFEIAANGTLYFAQTGAIDKKVWACAGATGPFQQLDLISHTGNFTQITDIDVSPDHKIHVAFNCLPTHSVMRYEAGITETSSISGAEKLVRVYPNPVRDVVYLEMETQNPGPFELWSADGRLVQSGMLTQPRLDLSALKPGLYRLRFHGDRAAFSLPLLKE